MYQFSFHRTSNFLFPPQYIQHVISVIGTRSQTPHMLFERKEKAFSELQTFVDEIIQEENKKNVPTKPENDKEFFVFRKTEDITGAAIHIETKYDGSWNEILCCSIEEAPVVPVCAKIVFRNKYGNRYTYEFKSVPDLLSFATQDRRLLTNDEILLVTHDGSPVYSSLLSPNKLHSRDGLEKVLNWFSDNPIEL